MNLELHIVSNIMFYEKNYVYLPRINGNWFTNPLHQQIIQAMQFLYLQNQPFGLYEIVNHIGQEKAYEVSMILNSVMGTGEIEPHIKQLQAVSLKRQLVDKLGGLDLTRDLKAITDDLTQYVEEAMIVHAKESLAMHKVTAKTFDDMVAAIDRGDSINGKPTGWNRLDRVIGGWNKGDVVIIAGRPGCFDGNQLIHTKRGVVPIKDITTKDWVLSYNVEKDYNEWKPVIATPLHPTTEDRMFKITMKDGTVIKVTENHEFFTGSKFVKIKEILLPLLNGKDLENNTRI